MAGPVDRDQAAALDIQHAEPVVEVERQPPAVRAEMNIGLTL